MLGTSTRSSSLYVTFTEPEGGGDVTTIRRKIRNTIAATVSIYPANYFTNFLHPNYFCFSYIRIISGFPTSGLYFLPLSIRFLFPIAISAKSFLLLPLTSFIFFFLFPSLLFLFPHFSKIHPSLPVLKPEFQSLNLAGGPVRPYCRLSP